MRTAPQIARQLLATFLLTACALSAQTSDETARRIQALIQQGDLTTARRRLVEAIKANRDDASLYNLQGAVQAQQADLAGAEKSFERAVELSPHFSGAYLNLGHLYEEASKTDPRAPGRALDVYERLLKFDPGDAEANYRSAVLLFQKGSFHSSIEHLLRLPAQDQEHAPVLSILCGDLAGQGDHVQATEAAKQLLQSPDLTEADVLCILPALAKVKEGVLTLHLLEGLRAKGLADLDSLQALAQVYKEEGKLDLARSTLEKAAKIQPNSVPILVSLAHVAHQQHDNMGALGYLGHARDLEPQNAGILFFWGIVCMEQNLTEEAYRALKEAVRLDSNNAYYNYAMGAATVQHGDAKESLAYFQKYCELRPDEARGRLALGAAYFGSGDDKNARPLLSTVLQYPETAAVAHYYMGRIANHEGDVPTAIRELRLALQASPSYADAYAELGLIHMKQKDYAQAEKALQRALKANPDSYTANLNLLVLYQRTKDPRAEAQAKRFDEVRERRAQKAQESFWSIEARPVYSEE
jgi:tetratricopeptide (TPR) repeat protein